MHPGALGQAQEHAEEAELAWLELVALPLGGVELCRKTFDYSQECSGLVTEGTNCSEYEEHTVEEGLH